MEVHHLVAVKHLRGVETERQPLTDGTPRNETGLDTLRLHRAVRVGWGRGVLIRSDDAQEDVLRASYMYVARGDVLVERGKVRFRKGA